MNILQRFINKLASNVIIKGYAGLTGLPRLTNAEWSEEKFLETYSTSLYTFACVRKIAEKVSQIEWKLYRVKNSKGELEEILNHPLLDLLYNPNPFHSKPNFVKLQQINQLLTGDSYWAKIMYGNKIGELWNLRPDWVKIVPDSQTYIKEYIYRVPGQKEIKFAPEEIIHFADPSPIKEFANRTGQSCLRAAQTRIDTEEYATKFQRDFFNNNARLDAVLQTDHPLMPDKLTEIENQWRKKYKGVGKNSKMAILEAGLKYVQIATSQKDMDYINGLQATRDDILTAFAVPKPIIAITDDVNRANAETAIAVFLSENIKPKMFDIIETLNQLLVVNFDKNLVLDCVDPSPENRELILKEYENGSTHGWLTQNEIRAKEGLPPIIGGDDPLVDKKISTMVGLEGAIPYKKTILLKQPVFGQNVLAGKGELYRTLRIKELEVDLGKQYKARMKSLSVKKKKEVEEKRKAHWRTYLADRDRRKNYILSDTRKFFKGQEKRIMESLVEKEYKTNGVYFKKYIKRVLDNIDWAEENKRLYAVLDPKMLKIVKVSGKAALTRLGIKKPFITEGQIAMWLKNRVEYHSALINETTKKKLSKQLYQALENGETLNEIKGRVKETYKVRSGAEAIRIARTETGTVINKASIEAYKQSGIVNKKEWIATMDDRVRPEHAAADGQQVGLNERFAVGGDMKEAPDDINCRCAVAPVVVEGAPTEI